MAHSAASHPYLRNVVVAGRSPEVATLAAVQQLQALFALAGHGFTHFLRMN